MALISPQLLEILVCPVCREPLVEDEAKGVLRCEKNGNEYPVRDGIPIMIVGDDGKPLPADKGEEQIP